MKSSTETIDTFDSMSEEERHTLLERLDAMGAEEILRWAAETHGERAAIVTSFQDTGCVMIDISQRADIHLRVVTIDPLRLHRETYELIDTIEKHYGLTIDRFIPDPDLLKQMTDQHGEYLFFDSKPKQEHCCYIRKVEPNRRALATLDVWFTGLRRDQSAARQSAPKALFIKQERRTILKLAPLVEWTKDRIDAYITENDVPHNALYGQGYTSIGCEVCSTPTKPGENARAGRWRWQNEKEEHKECGLHVDGSGI